MDESSTSPAPETDIMAMKEALYAQQLLLQNLYADLDEEREASATAASEALSMILRLQGEKASLKMESSQYKRMAEEKICHAEEALAIVEDLIYARELEIASLEYQVQAYRYRLLSMGCNDLGVYENTFPENLLMQRNDPLFGENGVYGTIKKFNSLPHVLNRDANHNKSTIDRKRSIAPRPGLTQMDEKANREVQDSERSSSGADIAPRPDLTQMDENANREVQDSERSSSGADINSYWDQIKRLDERVKEISESRDSSRNKSTIWKGGTWSPSLFSQMGIATSSEPTRKVDVTNTDQTKIPYHCNSHESVQDIFEVPQTTGSSIASEPPLKEWQKPILEGENRLGKPDIMVSQDILKSPNKDERDLIKTNFLSKVHEKKLPKPRDVTGVHRSVSPECHSAVDASNSPVEYQQLIQRVERLERARDNTRQEIVAEGEEEMNLLKEIREQLNSIQSEMRSLRTQKSNLPDHEPSLGLLQEAMLYFWF